MGKRSHAESWKAEARCDCLKKMYGLKNRAG